MVHIMVSSTSPPHKTSELLKVYLSPDKPKYPDFIKKIHNWGTIGPNARTIAIYEVDDDKVYEGLCAIANRYKVYTAVEGYTYEAEVLIDEKDALKIFK